MQMRPEIQINSVIKAMKDVVIPALDPNNQLAVEQSQLIIGILSLLASQLPVQYRFDRDELARLLETAEILRGVDSPENTIRECIARLTECQTDGKLTLERALIEPATLNKSVRELREAISCVIRGAASTGDTKMQLKIEKAVLDMSREQLLRDRSLMKMQGWESNPASLPAISELLAELPVTP